MKLDEDALAEAHASCSSVQGSAETFDAWLSDHGIDGDGLLENAKAGAAVWTLGAQDGNPVAFHFMTAIIAGFEWGYRARQMQELFDE